jgi:hypothetical protein
MRNTSSIVFSRKVLLRNLTATNSNGGRTKIDGAVELDPVTTAEQLRQRLSKASIGTKKCSERKRNNRDSDLWMHPLSKNLQLPRILHSQNNLSAA